MGTHEGAASPVATALFGKTRRAVLALLFGRPDESFHVRAIVRAADAGSGAVQRELLSLEQAEIIQRRTEGRQVYYRANAACPIFGELRAIVAKTVGLADVVRAALEPLAPRIRAAFIYGSAARGAVTAGSDVDVLVIGNVPFREVAEALHGIQERVGREVNPSVFTEAEWARRLRRGDHLPTSVREAEKIFLIGDERALGGLGRE
jgi:predicted nucleotidyltransferase